MNDLDRVGAQDAQRIFQAIGALRNHSLRKVAARRFKRLPTCLDDDVPDLQKLAVLMEELGEVANLFNQSTADDQLPNTTKLRDELLDVANAATLWAEAIRE